MNRIVIGLCLALTLLLLTAASGFPAAAKPAITISNPGENSEFLYQTDISVSVSVDNRGGVLAGPVVAFIDDGPEFTLDFDRKSNIWTVIMSELEPGAHTLTVAASNAAGTNLATNSFRIFVNFGQWMPPINGTDNHLRPGSILPVKFTLMGAKGPLDDSVIEPVVLLNGKAMGRAASTLDPATGLPYFRLKVKLPNKNCSIGVTDPDIKQGRQTLNVTVR